MGAAERWRAGLAGLAAGVSGGLFGVGGGLVLIPQLTGFFGLSQHQAHGTSLAVIGATAVAALVVYGSHHDVRWFTALVVGAASALTARYGARLAGRSSPAGLTRAFAIFLAVVGLRLLWKAPPVLEQPLVQGPAGLALNVGIGAAVGLLSGYMGVGGGILAVPAFTMLVGMTQQAAQGTSLAVILITAPAGAIEHSRLGNVAWKLVPALAIGAALGAPLASWMALRLPHEILVRTFAVFLLVGAAVFWVRAGARRGRASGPAHEGIAKEKSD